MKRFFKTIIHLFRFNQSKSIKVSLTHCQWTDLCFFVSPLIIRTKSKKLARWKPSRQWPSDLLNWADPSHFNELTASGLGLLMMDIHSDLARRTSNASGTKQPRSQCFYEPPDSTEKVTVFVKIDITYAEIVREHVGWQAIRIYCRLPFVLPALWRVLLVQQGVWFL